MNDVILDVKNLRTYFKLEEGTLKAVDGVDFSLGRKETLGIIGESGCGKSVTMHSVLRIIQAPGRIESGEILYTRPGEAPVDLAKADANGKYLRSLRGKDLSMIFQEPMSSMSPVNTIGSQIIEAVRVHYPEVSKKEARDRAVGMLTLVGMPRPDERINDYPHQLSGGMCQRAMIATALVNKPLILVADEPTTALDVTVQAQIIELMKELQEKLGMSIIYITHDMGVTARIADNIAVMYLGRIVERASARELFRNPQHPYTTRLLRSIPKIGRKVRGRLDAIKGNVPVPLDPPRECGFYSRCLEAKAGLCDQGVPPLLDVGSGHLVRCFLRKGVTL